MSTKSSNTKKKKPVFNPEIFTQPSLTIPDETKSIKELLINHARGIPLDVKNRGEELYFEDELIPTIKDLTDLDRYREVINLRKEALEAEILGLEDKNKEIEKKETILRKEDDEAKKQTPTEE